MRDTILDEKIHWQAHMQINPILIRYLFVGMINTAFGYSVFALLTYFGLHYPLALFFATVAGIFFNFRTFGRFVFANPDWRLIWRFFAVYGVLYGVNVGTVFVLMLYIPNVYIANAVALIFIASLGFVLNRRFVYANN